MKLKYAVNINTPKGLSTVIGSADLNGVTRITCRLPEGTIRSVDANVYWELNEGEKIFMNGYQTWTHCPELGSKDRIAGMPKVPQKLIRHFGLDRYGDYFFTPYPEKKGVSHGESWCYFRDGDIFRLVASLDEENGYTVFSYDAKKLTLHLSRDCAGLKCGGEFEILSLYFSEGSEQQVFDGWFEAMGVKPRTSKRLAGYTSWYNRYQAIDEKSITGDLAGAKGVLSEGDLFQIDDGWERFVGDWADRDTDKFQTDMRGLSDAIHGSGYLAGLWLAPFVCEKKSAIYREHPDWLLKHEGEEWYCGCNWSGFYALDIDNPQVVDYLKATFKKVFEEWNFDLVKLDFLYAAAPFGSDTETRAGRMIRAMKLLRELCGDKLILGCGVPVMPAFGLVDYCRISCDVGLDWCSTWYMRIANRETVNTLRAIHNTVFRRQLNGRAYMSDPDVFYLRDENLKLNDRQKYILAAVNALLGGIYLNSDDMGKYGEDKKALYKSLLRLRDAKNITVEADEGLSVSYEIDGVRETVTVE